MFNLFLGSRSGEETKTKKKSHKYVDTAHNAVASLRAGSAAVAHSYSSVETKVCHCDGTGALARSELSDKEVGYFSLSMPQKQQIKL